MFAKSHILIGLTLIVFSCSNPEPNYTEELIDGVRHIHNLKPLWGDEPKVRLEFVRTIGGLDETDENFIFFRTLDIALDNDKNIYVLDTGNYRVQKYDKDLNYILTFGGNGKGPGEFTRPASIIISPDDIINIEGIDGRGLHQFNTNGKYIKTIVPGIRFSGMHITKVGQFVIYSRNNNLKPEEDPLVKIMDSGFNLVKQFGSLKKNLSGDMKRMGRFYYIDQDTENNFYLVFSYVNRIEKYSPEGKLLLLIDRTLPYGETRDRKRIDNYRDGERVGYYLSHVNGYSVSASIDHKNRIWSITLTRQIDFHVPGGYVVTGEPKLMYEIFSSEGILLGNIIINESDSDRLSLRIFGDRLFLIDSYKKMQITEYRIVDN